MSDSRDLTARAADAATAHPLPVRQSDNLLAQVIAAAKDPNIDAAKMKLLADLVNGQQDRERELEFNQSKNAAIMEMPVITKDGRIVITKDGRSREQGRFARFEDIDRVIRPILQRHNLALGFDSEERQGGGIIVRPILTHANGFTERGGGMPLPADESGGKNKVQAVGSALQYGKRYTACAMLNIQTEGVDNDGNGDNAAVRLPYEREQLVRAEAEAAANEGKYVEWFSQQSPKDRAWLVNQQFHVDFGGQPLLTSQPKAARRTESESTPPPPPPPSPPPSPPPPPPPAAERTDTGSQKRTPEKMVQDFEQRLEAAKTTKEVVDLQAEPGVQRWMANLEERHPGLYQKVVDAAATAYADLLAVEREQGRSGSTLV